MMAGPKIAGRPVPEGCLEIDCAGERLRLHPERAVFWPRERILLVADLHLGKTAAFRSAGLAVPEGGGAEDLALLGRLVDATGALEVIILGDLLHARSGRTREVRSVFAAWRAERPELRISLVMGNHDHAAGAPPEDWGLEVWPEAKARGPFRFVHEAEPGADGYAIGGHVHPALAISDRAGGGFRAPCFLFGARHAILPAFGSFTGTHLLGADDEGRVFMIAEDRIFEIPEAVRAGGTRRGRKYRGSRPPQKKDASRPASR